MCAFPQSAPKLNVASSGGSLKQFSTALTARQQALEAAKQAGNPAAIAATSRNVIALSLRELGALKLAAGDLAESVSVYRRAIDFEDVPDAHVDLAAAYLISGRIDEALSETNNALLKDPQNARAWHVQGRVWLAKKNYTEAIHAFSQSRTLQANAVVSRLLALARRLSQAPAASQSVRSQHLDKSLAGELVALPQTKQVALRRILASALNDLGTSEARQQQFELALGHFHEAEQWDSQTPGLMRNLGLSAARAGDYKETVRALKPVLAANPLDNVVRVLLGTALFSRASFAEAAEVFAALGDSTLDNPEVGFMWASSLVKISKYPEASAVLAKLEARELPTETLILIAQTWSQMANYTHTVETCHRALQIDPKLPRAHSIAGLALIRDGKPGEAEQEFRSELQINPGDVDSQYHLAFVLLQQAKNQEAVRLLRSVVDSKPEHPEANYELGKQLLADGKPGDAIPYLEAAVRLKPQLEPVHYQLQSAYRAVGRKEDADREAQVYREMKAKSRNISLPPPREQKVEAPRPD